MSSAQPSSGGAQALGYRHSAYLVAMTLAVSAACADARIAEAKGEARYFPPMEYMRSAIDRDALLPRGWTQASSVMGPSDSEFAAVAIGLLERQKRTPDAIQVLLAQHMSELYD